MQRFGTGVVLMKHVTEAVYVTCRCGNQISYGLFLHSWDDWGGISLKGVSAADKLL